MHIVLLLCMFILLTIMVLQKRSRKASHIITAITCSPEAVVMLIFNVFTVRKRKDCIIIFLEITQFLSRRETGRIKKSMTRKNSQTGVQQSQNRHPQICLHFTKLLRKERTKGFFHSFTVLLHNGGLGNGCITKRFLHNFKYV